MDFLIARESIPNGIALGEVAQKKTKKEVWAASLTTCYFEKLHSPWYVASLEAREFHYVDSFGWKTEACI